MKPLKNIPASARQRLLNRAKIDRRPFNELLQYYAMERFLYRLSKSVHADRFILKGALMLRVWNSPEFRPTMDIDMLGRTSNEVPKIIAQIRDILSADVEPDGLTFDPDSITAERITEDADYAGIRIRFPGKLGSARINMQVDIGFGDVVYPEPVELSFPAMLNYPAPLLLCYSRESSVAEKLEAMVKLGQLNSRMKDFYDILYFAKNYEFKKDKLNEAILITFKQRETNIEQRGNIFNEKFGNDDQLQKFWIAFLTRTKLTEENNFSEVVKKISSFIEPVFYAETKNNWNSENWVWE